MWGQILSWDKAIKVKGGFGVGGGGATTAEGNSLSWEIHGQNLFKCFLRDLGSPAATTPRGVAEARSSPESPPGITPSPPGQRLWSLCVAYLETASC
ncbi:hypothetical protein Y1Q_0023623 [Alligator mississippiensis]|uniref:Uncharacterized protein n=1 Tax=Alligator mississippiensis TaxID=8496 RepID=A0A151MMS7_ALLMI|nr:hypothetical protein Y1Q_0023623 [Alligator mississippiensis]